MIRRTVSQPVGRLIVQSVGQVFADVDVNRRPFDVGRRFRSAQMKAGVERFEKGSRRLGMVRTRVGGTCVGGEVGEGGALLKGEGTRGGRVDGGGGFGALDAWQRVLPPFYLGRKNIFE